jgi:polyisoprenoid-binding protein YceI
MCRPPRLRPALPLRALPLGALLLGALLLLAACADVGEAPAAETTALGPPAADTPADSVADPAAPAPPPLAGTPLPVDTVRSRIGWRAAKVTRTHEGGFRRFEGAVYLDGGRVTGAEVTADARSIFSDDERLTGHLRGPDFFEVERHPVVRFRIDEVVPLAPGDSAGATHRAAGTLEMRGRTNRVAFPATIRVAGGAVSADADFTIDRQDWGLSYPGAPDDLIRDEVRVVLQVFAGAPAPG